MELKDLNDDELITLAGLMREVIRADHQYSDAEHVHVDKLKETLGETRFNAVFATAQKELGSLDEVKERAKQIENVEARRVIFGYLIGLAAADGVHGDEEKPLRWLASWWDFQH